jgi:hypothetical protein
MQRKASLATPGIAEETLRKRPRGLPEFWADQTPYEKNSQIQRILTAAWIIVTILEALPFRLIENPVFRWFLRLLNPRWTPPSRELVSDKIEECHQIVRANMRCSYSSGRKPFCLIVDRWSNKAGQSIEAVSSCMVNDDLALSYAVVHEEIAADEKGWNAEASQRALNSGLEFMGGATHCVGVVADSAKSNRSASCMRYGVAGEPQQSLTFFWCAAHLLHNVLAWKGKKDLKKKGLLFLPASVAPFTAAVQKAREVSSFYRKSLKANTLLLEEQRKQGTQRPLRTVLDEPTRWTATHSMIGRILRIMASTLAAGYRLLQLGTKAPGHDIRYLLALAASLFFAPAARSLTPFFWGKGEREGEQKQEADEPKRNERGKCMLCVCWKKDARPCESKRKREGEKKEKNCKI